jgi:membrane protease YdiL (CAAX protease family)
MKIKGTFAGINLFSKLILTGFVGVVGLMLSLAIGSLFVFLFYRGDATGFSMFLSSNISSLKTLQFAQSIGLFVLPAIVMAYLLTDNVCDFLSLKKKPTIEIALVAMMVMIVATPLINWLAEQNAAIKLPAALNGLEQWMKRSEDAANILTEKFLVGSSFSGLFLNIFLMAIVPAICEELFFRGLLQTYFKDWTKNSHAAIWITAFIFSAIHFQFYGFVPRMLMGAVLGYLLVWSGSIWVPILAHFANNAMGVIFYFLTKNGYLNFDIDKTGTNETVYATYISLFLVSIMLVFIYKKQKRYN